MKRLLHVGFNPIGTTASLPSPLSPPNFYALIEGLFTRVADWYRFGNQNYVLFTDLDPRTLAEAVRALPGFEGVYFFASEIELDFSKNNGMMPPAFWEWIRQRGHSTRHPST